MTDERFERDLADVLRTIAGEEAPMSLRFHLSDITERAPMSRRLWFATPMRLSMGTAAAVAVLALAIIFLPREVIGPPPTDVPSESASLSPSVSASIEPTPSLEPTSAPTDEPTPMPTIGPTLAPTPAPTPSPLAVWTGLTWSDPVTPSFVVHLADLVPWGEEYVAVGSSSLGGGGAYLTSPDGLNWTIVEQDDAGVPSHLVALGDELLAFSHGIVSPPGYIVGRPPFTFISRSTDGESWDHIDSRSWDEAWAEAWAGPGPEVTLQWDEAQYDITQGFVDVASGPDGLVAIGNSYGDDAMAPIILHSTDGQSWTAAALPAGSDSALLNAVAERDGRFVITGATGVWTDPATARAAAWYSDDGLTWVRAAIEPDGFGSNAGTELGPVWAGADGLLACRGNREMAAGGWRFMTEWLSVDGTSWQVAPNLDQSPGCDWSAADGTRIVSLGPRAHASPVEWPGVTGAWTSTDGEHWQTLTLSSTLSDRLERFWVVPDGVIYAGEQSFWFGTPVEE